VDFKKVDQRRDRLVCFQGRQRRGVTHVIGSASPGRIDSETAANTVKGTIAVVNDVLSALLAVTSGYILWIWAADASGKLEAWDGPFYFSRVIPALGVTAGCCGFIAPRHAWRWPALMYASQFLVMMVRAEGPVGPLAPLGFIMMGVLAVLTVLPAYVGALARRAWDRRFPTLD
jgi:hypothetical protein